MVVGAYGNDDDGTDSGSVYLFTKPSGGWVTATETVKLTAPDGAAGDNFGDSVAAGGGRAIVGAPGDESETGAAYVFRIPTWTAISGSGPGTTSHTVTGLDNDVEYTFLIRPVDSGGPGPASGSKHAKPQQAPAATPTNLTAAAGVGEVTLSWDDPNDSTITAYKYRQKEAGGSFGQWTTIPDSAYGEANTTGYTVSNLTNGQTYTFRIRAVDEDGDTANSNDVTVTTILAAPTNLTATVGVGAGQIALDWDNPNNTLITKYQYSTDGGTSFNDITGSSATTTEYTVTGLGNGTEYTLAVRAVNASVNGEAATVTATTRLPLVPLYVSNIGQPTDTSVGVEADLSSDQAQGFRTGTNGTGYVLGSIDVHFQSPPGSGVLTVSVREPNDDAEPSDTALYTLTHLGTIEAGFVRFTALDNAQLGADTFYFVHLTFSGTGTTPLLRTTASDALDSGTATGWTMNDFRYYPLGTDWQTNSNALKISINEVLNPPDAPANLEATVGDGYVVLSWDNPQDDYITKYQYSTDGGTSYTDIALTDIDSSETGKFKYTVENLDNGATYTFEVRAVNSAGNGATDTVEASTIPAAPANLTAMPLDMQVQLTWDDPANTTITDYELFHHAQRAALTASDVYKFGYSVAADGDIAVVGAPGDPDSEDGPGAAFVFSRSAGVWTLKYKLKSNGAVQDDEFGNSVAFDGKSIVVGAPSDDGNATGSGAAYVFTKPVSGWDNSNGTGTVNLSETAKLTASDGEGGDEGDEFGNSVAVHGDTVVVGAYAHDGTKGKAYVFTKPGTGWASATETAQLTASNGAEGDYFGDSVAIDGDTIVVGADEKGNATGSAYVFVKPGTGWATDTEDAQLTASDGVAGDYFGNSVAIDGDVIVVGADENDSATGSAYVFVKPDSGWADDTETAQLTASDGMAGDKFGYSVAVDGDTVVVGANEYNDISLGTDSGSAYVFVKPDNDDGWAHTKYDGNEAAKLTASNGRQNHKFGTSVAVNGDTVLVGAENKAANDEEAAYAFDIKGWDDIGAAGTKSHKVPSLTNNIEYTFAVRAVNDSGDGPASIATATPMPVPTAPQNLQGTPGDGQIALTWDAPDPLDDTITGYEYSTDYITNGGGNGNNGGATFTAITGSGADTTGYTVTDLDNGVTYTLALRAVNDFGAGMPSTVDALMVPAAPKLSAASGNTEVSLSWADPDNGTIKSYQLWQVGELIGLQPSDGTTDDFFGHSLAVDGDTAVIGAPQDTEDPGLVYVFTRNSSGAWSQQGKLTTTEGSDYSFFGRSVAVHGDTAVVGAPKTKKTSMVTALRPVRFMCSPGIPWAPGVSRPDSPPPTAD